MCGRFSLHTDGAALAEQFGLPEVPALEPRYNIAPTQPVLVVRQEDGARRLRAVQWGLVPSWADDPAMGAKLINARGETVAEKPSFRSAFARRRCLVPADGFYEWQASGKGRPKQPYYIRMEDERPFAFAGLWEYWEGAEGALETCTIITTEPNDLLRPLHNRMPVILPAADYAQWLDPDTPRGPLGALLRPYPPEEMSAYPVRRTVNNARHEGPECIAAAE
jgi:putative SOS response-associated peptidase YedK